MGDLSGKKVAVIKGTTNEAALVSYLGESLIDAKVVLADSDEDALALLETSEVDAVASDQVVLIGQSGQSDDPGQWALSEDLFSFEPYGFMVRRNDADFRLVANRSLAQLYRTGQYRNLYNKWFGRIGIKPSPVLAAMYKLQGLPE